MAAAANGDASPAQTVATQRVMREKLVHTEQILRALMTSNYSRLQQESEALARAPQMPGWMVLNTPEFARHSAAFVNALRDIVAAAQDRDLDGAAVHFTALTMTCYQCHRYLKNVRVTESRPPADSECRASAKPRAYQNRTEAERPAWF